MCPLVAYARILRHGRKRGYWIDGYLMTCQNNTEKPVLQTGRDKTRIRMRIRMADTDADEKIRMRKGGWRIKRG